jgi:hypothetical protein
MNDLILFSHATFGVLGMLAALWVFVEAWNASEANQQRIWRASLAVAAFISLAWVLGGYWYVTLYPAEKAIILQGPWPFAHKVVMETKEHLFFIPLLLALYLPLLTRIKLAGHAGCRTVVMTVAAFIVLTCLAMEGGGALVNYGVKVAFIHTGI